MADSSEPSARRAMGIGGPVVPLGVCCAVHACAGGDTPALMIAGIPPAWVAPQ